MRGATRGGCRLSAICAASLLVAVSSPLSAKDHVLTIGGGYSPAGNQVSLERNVVFFEKLLAERLPQGTAHDLYFADGDSPGRDLQFLVEGEGVPRPNRLMAGLFGSEDDLDNQYRDHQLDGVRGKSGPAEVEKWFTETGATLKAGDRLILYVTAHGGRGGKDNKHNTRIWMWDRQSIDAAKLAAWIKALPEGVSVMTVQVQCYSGGFSHLIFEENNASKGDSAREICGFYATVHDREAAGCTPDVNEANYDEFSSHFWAALRGKTRLDKPVSGCDYDGDGQVSFEEAHAYAILVSRNIDIPVKTSDAFLRAHSAQRSEEKENLLAVDTPYSELLKRARPVEREVLEGLSKQLGVGGEERGAEVAEKAKELGEALKKIDAKLKAQKKTLDGERIPIARTVRNRWPELKNKHSPGAVRLLSDAKLREEFVTLVESHPKFERWGELKKQRAQLEEEELELEKEYATYRRLVWALESVALAANLEKVADEEKRSRYRRLLKAEAGGLGE